MAASRFLQRAALFCLTLLLLLMGVDASIGLATTRYEELKYRALFDREARHAHIVIGNSHAMHGIDPRQIEAPGFSLYNFAFSGGNPLFFERWYKLYRAYQPAPKVVLLSADWFIFKPVLTRRFEHDAEYMPPAELAHLILDPLISVRTLLANRFPLIKEREPLARALIGEEPPTRVVVEAYHKGYAPYHVRRWGHQYPYKARDSRYYQAAFVRLLDLLAAEGARVVFVQVPEYLPDAGEHPVENARLEAIAAARGIPFLNYNAERKSAFNYDRSLFTDWGHMNERGSARFGPVLRDDLQALRLF